MVGKNGKKRVFVRFSRIFVRFSPIDPKIYVYFENPNSGY
jgi:hypothetical protein